jgi:hypothetical protein
MKRIKELKVYLVFMFILTVFIILPGCSGGELGGGSWNDPSTVADTTKPTVSSTIPGNDATGVLTNADITATFSKVMDTASPATSFTLKEFLSGNSVEGAVSYVGNTATFNPTIDLLTNTKYTATVSTAAKDLAGNALANDKVWSFTTGTGTGPAPGAVALGLAATFGSFGGTAGMTNSGTLTSISGDIGTTATATGSITGFHDASGDIYTESPANIGTVTGNIFTCTNSTTGPTSTGVSAASCTKATQARLDAQTAYLALAALAPVGPGQPANLAGLTVPPGVYKSPSGSFLIEGGDLTLNGDANAVWVFQMATTLTVGGPGAAAPQNIILTGGALAKNVYWQVGSFATINAAGGGTMVGTIISQEGAAFSTLGNVNTVHLNGRVLSLGASVTMVDTVITLP